MLKVESNIEYKMFKYGSNGITIVLKTIQWLVANKTKFILINAALRDILSLS